MTYQDESKPSAERDTEAEIRGLQRELAIACEERDMLKKSHPRVLSEPPAMKFAFIAEHRREFKITHMCGMLGVSRSGFFAWLKRQ